MTNRSRPVPPPEGISLTDIIAGKAPPCPEWAVARADDPPRIAACRTIGRESQRAKVEGKMVDLFSAQALCKVYDAVNEKNRALLLGMDIGKAITVAFKVLK